MSSGTAMVASGDRRRATGLRGGLRAVCVPASRACRLTTQGWRRMRPRGAGEPEVAGEENHRQPMCQELCGQACAEPGSRLQSREARDGV